NLTGISGGPANETQNLTLAATSTNTTLLANPAISYVNGNNTGTLTLRPANGASGISLVTVTVDDGGSMNSSVSQSFLVVINATANARPTLSTITNVTLNEDTSSAPIP